MLSKSVHPFLLVVRSELKLRDPYFITTPSPICLILKLKMFCLKCCVVCFSLQNVMKITSTVLFIGKIYTHMNIHRGFGPLDSETSFRSVNNGNPAMANSIRDAKNVRSAF